MERNRREINPPDGGYGWIIVFSCVVINSSLTPLMQCFGIIYESKFHEMNISAAEISFLLHLHNSIMCSLGLLSGPLLKKYNFRQIAICGCFLVCIGITITSFAQSYGHLIFTICFLVGTGQGTLMPSVALAINSYFKKRLTLAMSYSITGVGLLPIVMPQICNFLLEVYGTKGTVLILAAISYHAFLGALLLRPLIRKNFQNRSSSSAKNFRNLEESNKKVLENGTANLLPSSQNHDVSVYNETTTPIPNINVEKRSTFSKLFTLLNLELFKERAYVLIIVGMGISYVAELNFTLMTPFVLSELAGFTRADVALAMSMQAAADIGGRLFIPIISHKSGWSPKFMYAASLVGSSIGRTFLAIFCDTKNIVLACSILLGLSKGAKAVYQSLILPKYVSLEKLPSAMGFLMVINGILSLIIGPVIGAIHDVSQSYVYALHTATLLSVFCMFLWIVDTYELKYRSNKSNLGRSEELQANV